MILDSHGKPIYAEDELTYRRDGPCDHGILFDEDEYKKNPNMSEYEVRKRWPRLNGPCPKGCGFCGIGYASALHYIAGDW